MSLYVGLNSIKPPQKAQHAKQTKKLERIIFKLQQPNLKIMPIKEASCMVGGTPEEGKFTVVVGKVLEQ